MEMNYNTLWSHASIYHWKISKDTLKRNVCITNQNKQEMSAYRTVHVAAPCPPHTHFANADAEVDGRCNSSSCTVV